MKYINALILFLLLGVSGAVMAQSGDMSSDEIERIAHSVVMITNVQGGEELFVGSGTIVSSTGLIYTNRHVVEDAEDLNIYVLEDMNEQPVFRYRARALAVFSEMDFAILQIDRNANGSVVIPTTLDLPFLTPVHNEIDRGTRIYIFGYPTIGNGYLVLTDGLISSAINDTIGEERMVAWYQTNAEIAPGNSGGLAVTAAGELVGIPTSVQSEDRTAGRLGGILPFRAVMALVEAGAATSIDTVPNTNTNPNSTAQGSAELEITDIEANVERNGANGTLIHLHAIVRGYKDLDVLAAVYFYDGDGNLVAADESATTEYVDANGWLRSRLNLTPGFDATEWDDITFWLPYGAFPHGLSGSVSFYAEADINDGEGWIAPSERHELVLVYDDNSTTTTTSSQGDTFTEVTNIEHNVELNGANGMTVHVHAIVRGYKDQTVAAAVYFYDTDGDLVPASDAAADSYIDANGWLRSRLELEPGFDATEWDDMTFWVPYSAFPTGTGDVTYFAEADVYDGENWIAPSEHYELVLSFGDSSTTDNTSSGGGVTAVCNDFSITNGVQIVVRQMRPNFTYTATVVGIDGFDPVMIIGNPNDPSNNICNDDADDASKYQVDLPSTGLVAASSRSSQLFFTHTNANMTDISIIIGDYNGNAGEFVLVLEGMAVTSADGAGDPFTVMANSSVVGATAPMSVYMIGLESQLDPMVHLYNGDNQVWTDTDGAAINCDDAGNSSICWGESVDLSGAQIRRGTNGTATADSSDAMLTLPIQSIAPQPMTFLMNSYEGSSTGLYAIVFHMGLS